MKKMPTWITMTVLCFGLLITVCKPDPEEEASITSTVLKIKNESAWTIENIKWQDKNSEPSSLKPGSIGTIEIPQGSAGYIFFSKLPASINCRTQSIAEVETGETKEFTFTDNTVVVQTDDTANIQTLGAMEPRQTYLAIKNDSSFVLQNVTWNGKHFATSTAGSDIEAGGAQVKNTVAAGSQYIFFARKKGLLKLRTKNAVSVAAYEDKVYTIDNNTEVVEAAYDINDGTLQDIQKMLVFFDDAESGSINERQEYTAISDDARYYKAGDFTDSYNETPYGNYSLSYYYYPPKNGDKSIAIDGSLRLSFTLDRKARLSFWYAHKHPSSGRKIGGDRFSIDGTMKASWGSDIPWTEAEYEIEAGTHHVEWTQYGAYWEGPHPVSGYSSHYDYYLLNLDDILIVYTE
ncbi:MAG: hypothetical protein LBT95_02345 [Treponema sp.]|jgi:hypothetical protein|nr:hypothetical protein [Treponema sp.]